MLLVLSIKGTAENNQKLPRTFIADVNEDLALRIRSMAQRGEKEHIQLGTWSSMSVSQSEAKEGIETPWAQAELQLDLEHFGMPIDFQELHVTGSYFYFTAVMKGSSAPATLTTSRVPIGALDTGKSFAAICQ